MTEPERVQIEVIRPGKPMRVFHEGLLADDGRRVMTSSLVRDSATLSAAFHGAGLIPAGARIERVDKSIFYHEPFTVMRLYAGEGELLGCYCDIATPVEKTALGYRYTDLFLDLWIGPDGAPAVLDEEELAEALARGVVSPAQAEFARAALVRMLAELAAGGFPALYIA